MAYRVLQVPYVRHMIYVCAFVVPFTVPFVRTDRSFLTSHLITKARNLSRSRFFCRCWIDCGFAPKGNPARRAEFGFSARVRHLVPAVCTE